MAKCFHLGIISLTLLLSSASISPRLFAEERSQLIKQYIGEDAVQALHEQLPAYLTNRQIANISFGVWQDGLLVTEGYYGPVSEAERKTVSETSIHRIQSMTKPITAVGLLILMERGHFKLSDPITDFLPEFARTETLADHDADGNLYTYRAPHPPTMAQLLSHTAGLGYWRAEGGPIDQKLFDANIARSENTDQLVQAAAQVPYASMPGAEWRYSIASDLQGAIIERITGEPLSTFLETEIFTPLGMHDTRFHVPAHKQARLSGVTKRHRDRLNYVEQNLPTRAAQDKIYHEGGHGLFSTQRDYFLFLDFLQSDGRSAIGPLLLPETLDQLRTNAITYRQRPGRQNGRGGGAGLGYGFGVGIIENPSIAKMSAPKGTYYWHGSLGTWFWVDPRNDIIFVGMIQSETSIEPNPMKLSMHAIYGDGTETSYTNPPS